MNLFEAIIQGIIQGLTEFLPVSSSGHLTITQHIFGMEEDNLFFSVMLHIGTLAAVIGVYIKLIAGLLKEFGLMVKDIFTGKFKWSEMDGKRNMVMMIIIGLLPLFLLFLPIPGTDMKLKDLADLFSKSGYFIVVGLALMTTSVLLFLGDRKNQQTARAYKKKGIKRPGGPGRKKYNVVDAVAVGLTQCVAAIFPGISRSGSTLVASELRGINKQRALDYSFILGTPAIVAAAILEGKEALFPDNGEAVKIDYFPVIIGMIIAAVVGFLAIKLFKWLLSTDRMYIFILYTGIVGALVFVISIIELITGANLFTGQPLIF
ncbi:MAG: undecaprenyl-diphosphate phosphatase [Clostridia bacterium]|nr:undecaprenyl-diphosphate phosphatase [Clostridia bacterium]